MDNDSGYSPTTVVGGDGMALVAVGVITGIGALSGTTFWGMVNVPLAGSGTFINSCVVRNITAVGNIYAADVVCRNEIFTTPSVGPGPEVGTADKVSCESKNESGNSVHSSVGAK